MSDAGTQDDLTRKQRREAAREQRKAAEAAAAARATRQRRLLQVGAILGVAVVVVVLAIVLSSSGGSSGGGGLQKGAKATSTEATISTLLAGIPQNGLVLGNSSAPVTLDYYGDLECPICRDFTLQTLPQVIQDLVRTGKLKIQYRSLETATQDPSVFQQQQVAAYAAGQQNKAWYFIETFYHEQGQEDSGYVNNAFIDGIASQVPGMNLTEWQTARNDASLAAAVKADQQAAASNGFNATPTLVAIGPKGGKGVTGLVPYSAIQQLVSSVS